MTTNTAKPKQIDVTSKEFCDAFFKRKKDEVKRRGCGKGECKAKCGECNSVIY